MDDAYKTALLTLFPGLQGCEHVEIYREGIDPLPENDPAEVSRSCNIIFRQHGTSLRVFVCADLDLFVVEQAAA